MVHGKKENGSINNAAGYLAISTRNNITGTGERMRIDSSGRVGIGTTTPGRTLDVVGSIRSGGSTNPYLALADGTTEAYFEIASSVTRISSGTSQPLAFRIGSSEAARLDSSGRLLVGTSDGSGGVSKLVVQGASNGSAVGVAQISYNGLSSAVLAADTDIGYLRFTDQGSNSGVFAQITASTDGTTGASDYPGRLVFSTTADGSASPTERMRITSTGQMRLAGAGITFNGDTAAANELDDYEEGTWTATLDTWTGTAPTTTVTATGQYTKIGRLVHVEVQFSNVSTAGASGDVKISGLPFSASTGNPATGNCAAYLFDFPPGLTSLSFQASGSDMLPIHSSKLYCLIFIF
jgi:hypothetical protein